ncbi:MAG: ribosome maturation factor RimM [Bacteroidales bacterium]|nr:ribosome maturation factor RimM [Bacteroidales bacterium]
MTYKKHILIGRIRKVHGFQGAVTVKTERSFTGDIPEEGWVFIEIEGKPVPFYVTGTDYAGADLVRLWFDGYDTAEKVGRFTGCNVFLISGKTEGEIINGIEDLKGIEVLTVQKQSIGVIKEVIMNPGQVLLSILSSDNKEILIPLHEDFIVQLDPDKKVLVMDLPEGLTEINY